MFRLNIFIDLAEGQPGMLIPVFTSPNTNIPYVQQMDEFMLVKEIVPFLEYENYQCFAYDNPRTIAVGDKGIIAFRSFDESIVCGDFEEVVDYIDQNQAPIAKNLVLQLQLQRVESTDLKKSYELWRLVATKIFDDEEQAKFWVDSELQLFQKQKRIWADIDPLDQDDLRSGEGLQHTSITQVGTEYLLRWLSNRVNFSAKNWTTIWHYVHEKLPFDDRVSQVALARMYSLASVGWAKRSVPTSPCAHSHRRNLYCLPIARVGTAHSRLCPPYNFFPPACLSAYVSTSARIMR
jgi:hypothetical protein